MKLVRSMGPSIGLAMLLGLMAALSLNSREGTAHPDDVAESRSPAARAELTVDDAAQRRLSDTSDTVHRLTGPATEDDYPATTVAPNGDVWLAFVAYQRGQPIVMEQVRQRRFDSLITTGHGDQIRLMRFDGQQWHDALDVTDSRLDVWRPAVAVDGAGHVVVAWAQAVDGDWEILCRSYTPPQNPDGEGKWSSTVRITHQPGSDFHVVAATDARGRVWLAWQGWRKDNFDIQAAWLENSGEPRAVPIEGNSSANEWSPSIAADANGRVFIAWDTYARGNYDVRLQVFGKQPQTFAVAESARFEARPHLACDRDNRLWIAYSEGDEQWGKDYTLPPEWGRNQGEVDPGFGLYVHRTPRVKCLVDGKLQRPAHDVQKVFDEHLPGNKSLPRLAPDADGRIWLLFRRHLTPGGRSGGEAWHGFATFYDGRQWSQPQQLPNSSNLMDNRPALSAVKHGLLTVYSSDTRTRTERRQQNDLLAEVLSAADAPQPLTLVDDEPVPEPKVAAVHPQEAADVARMREFRLKIGGKSLRLLRGDFHRHTEYTAHRDGDGLLEDMWRYALDAGRLDWLGNGDHDNGYGHEYHWWQIQKVTDLMHNPPEFVAAQSYERSNRFPDGHRNVILPRRGIRPLPRGSLQGSAETGTPDTKLLYDYLKHFGGMCAAHTSATGMGTDWRDNDPDVEPVVEIFQGCRQVFQSYEHLGAPRAAPKPDKYAAGFVWNALEKGYRLGFQASSDHFATHNSYAVVLAEDVSRQAIIEAFKRRHCYGTNDNIMLVVRSGEHLMGDVFETTARPVLDILIQAPKPIAKLHVVRNNRYVFTTEPKKKRHKVRYTDVEAEAGHSYYYYVRAEQTDGSLAWASPMWITYQP